MQCTLESGSCTPGRTCILRLSDPGNAHAELWTETHYNWSVCCKTEPHSNLNTACPGDTTLLNLSDTTNAHAEYISGNYSKGICLSTDRPGKDIECHSHVGASCPAGEICVVKLSSDTNAHLSGCIIANYTHSICCKLVDE